jgi:kinetochore protein Mis13/DSN1
MRQLLIWCATRALGDKPSSFHQEDQSAHLAGKFFCYED